MIIVEDSRETLPLSFTQDYIDYVMRAKLDYGDYACVVGNTMLPVYFDRKSIPDLFGTLTIGYERFKREVNRCAKNSHRLIIAVEGNVDDVYKGHSHSNVKGVSIYRTLLTLEQKHGVPFVCCGSRKGMARHIAEYFRSFVNNVVNKKG